MSTVRIEVYRQGPSVRGPRLLAGVAQRVEEADAHDVLRDLLHSAGVEHPERAILEGGPVYDGGATYEITWQVHDEEEGT